MAKHEAKALEFNSRKLLKMLIDDGWTVVRVSGSHHVLQKNGALRPIVVAHPTKDLPLGTVRNIYRAAGWL